jgi:hypothetical protein
MITMEEIRDYYKDHNRDETQKYLVRKYGLSKREARELISGQKPAAPRGEDCLVRLTERQEKLVTGSLLGDGCLTKSWGSTGVSVFREGHGIKQLEYLLWKIKELKPISREHYLSRDEDGQAVSAHFGTSSTLQLGELEKKWYLRDDEGNYVIKNKKRVKCIPVGTEDALDPFTVAVWFFDDGHSEPHERRAGIATFCFTFDECDRLVSGLKRLGISDCVVRKNNRPSGVQPTIHIQPRSFIDFIDMIKPHMDLGCKEISKKVDLSRYTAPISADEKKSLLIASVKKWRDANPYAGKGDNNPSSKLTSDKVIEIKRLSETLSGSEIAKRFGITPANVSAILTGKTWSGVGGGAREPHRVSSGVSGVYEHKREGRKVLWQVKVKGHSYGYYGTKEEAIEARSKIR